MVYYSLERHKKLLQEQKTNLESPELQDYRIAIQTHILWQERDQIVLFLEDLLIGEIDAKTFCSYTLGLRRKVNEGLDKYESELISRPENVENFQPDKEGIKLSGLLTAFFTVCDNLEEDDDQDSFNNNLLILYSNLKRTLEKNEE